MTAFVRTVHQSLGNSRVFQVILVVGAAWTKSASNYWTIDLRITSPTNVLGRVIGSYSLQTRNLVAGTPVTVYSSSVGLAMSDGERLRATVTPTGTPVVLTDAVLFAQVQRNARPQ